MTTTFSPYFFTAFMPMLDEGTDVWRPVELLAIDKDTFQIQSKCPADEKWKFKSGELVVCEQQLLSSGSALVITALKK